MSNIKDGYYYCIDNNFTVLYKYKYNAKELFINNKFYLKNDAFDTMDVYDNNELIAWFFLREMDFPKHFISVAESRDRQINSIFEDE